MKVEFIWGSEDRGENGLWADDYLFTMDELGHSLDYMLGCTQSRLEKIAEHMTAKHKRDTALPAWVDRTDTLEDWLG